MIMVYGVYSYNSFYSRGRRPQSNDLGLGGKSCSSSAELMYCMSPLTLLRSVIPHSRIAVSSSSCRTGDILSAKLFHTGRVDWSTY